MTKEERSFEIIMLIAMAKTLSDQSTYLQNELSGHLKHDFNTMTRRTDDFIKRCESMLDEGQRATLQEITDAINNRIADIRNQILTLKA